MTSATLAIVREALEAAKTEFETSLREAQDPAGRILCMSLARQMQRALAALAPALAEEHRRIAG